METDEVSAVVLSILLCLLRRVKTAPKCWRVDHPAIVAYINPKCLEQPIPELATCVFILFSLVEPSTYSTMFVQLSLVVHDCSCSLK